MRKRSQIFISILCFTSIAVAVVVAGNSVATEYELSIYAKTPVLFWVLLLVCMIGSVLLITYRALSGNRDIHMGFIIGPLTLANVTVFLLPVLRGYSLYASSDSLVHLGWGLDVARTGHLGDANFYPAIHILIAQLSQICNLSPTSVGKLLPVFLSVGSMIWIYWVGSVSLPERGQALLSVALASGFLLNNMHIMVYPQTLPFLLILMVLYLRLNGSVNRNWAGKILLVISLLALPYSHPVPSAMIVLLLFALELSDVLYKRISGSPFRQTMSINLPLISTIAFFMWIASFAVFGQTLRALGENLREPLGGPNVQALGVLFEQTSPKSVAGVFLKMYGDSLLCLLLAAIGAAIIIVRVRAGRKGLGNLCALTAVWLATGPLELFVFAGTGRQTVARLANLTLAVFLSPLLAGYGLYEALRHMKWVSAFFLSIILVVVVWTSGLLGVYHSPWILQPSWQLMRAHVQGSEWFLENKEDTKLFTVMDYPYMLLHAIPHITHGRHFVSLREDLLESVLEPGRIRQQGVSRQFSYDRFMSLGQAISDDRYLLITKRFQLVIGGPELRGKGLKTGPPMFADFDASDFELLEQDPSVNKVYSNGELEIRLVRVELHSE